VAQSSRISVAKDDAAKTTIIDKAAAAAPRNRVRMFSIVLSSDLSKWGLSPDGAFSSTSCGILRFRSVRNNEFVAEAGLIEINP
jgi:hypothetical protein